MTAISLVLAHGGANWASDAYVLSERASQVRSVGEAGPDPAETLSWALQGLAWWVHTSLLSRAQHGRSGWRSLPTWQRVVELLAFFPVILLVAQAIGGFAAPGTHQDFNGFTLEPDPFAQWTAEFLTFPILTWVSLQRVDPAVRPAARWFFALSRGLCGALLAAAACVPSLVLSAAVEGGLGVFGVFWLPTVVAIWLLMTWNQVARAAPSESVTSVAPSRPTRIALGLAAMFGGLWGFGAPGVLWELPGLRSIYAISWLISDSGLPAGVLARAWAEGRIDVVAVRVATHPHGYAGYCAVWRCEECALYIGDAAVAGGNAGMQCSGLGALWKPCNGPVRSRGDLFSTTAGETDIELCDGRLLIAHDEYNGD